MDTLPAPRPDPLPASGAVKPYRPGSMLLPRFWTPWVQVEDDENRFGLATGGSDALFRHVWAARATYGTESDRVNASGFYLYDRFRPTFLVSAQDTTDVYTDGQLRTRQVSLQAALPLRRTVRSIQTVSATWRREREEVLGSDLPEDRVDLGGIETAWAIASPKSYPYSISPVDGGRLRLAWLHEAKALGSDLSLDKVTADARYYQRVFGERDVLALRAGGGTTYGEEQFERSFAVGGFPDGSLFDIVRTNNAVLRGYPDNAFTGRRYAVLNAEYRFPLFSPQRGWRSFPLFLRHFSGSVFFDAANAWSGEFQAGDLKTAAGASIALDSAIGYALPLTAAGHPRPRLRRAGRHAGLLPLRPGVLACDRGVDLRGGSGSAFDARSDDAEDRVVFRRLARDRTSLDIPGVGGPRCRSSLKTLQARATDLCR